MNNGASTASLVCNRCKVIVYFNELANVAETCQKRKCWIKKKEAVMEAALKSGKHPDDFIAVAKGEIIVHKVETPRHNPVVNSDHYSSHGFCD